MLLLKIKHHTSLAYKKLLFKIGLGRFLLQNRYGERIIVFHGIDFSGETKYNSRFISKTYFEELMHYFSEHYHVLSLEDYYAGKFKKGILNIALTFDDGLLNNYELALPILQKYNMPATFFITTIQDKKDVLWPDFLDLVTHHTTKSEVVFEGNVYRKNSKQEFSHKDLTLKNRCKSLEYCQIEPVYDLFEEEWNKINSKTDVYWKLLHHAQIRKIAKNPLFTIGGHGMTHSNLNRIANGNAEEEILSNKTILENIIGQKIDSFAFPFGAYNTDLIRYCGQIGYSKILLLDYQNEHDKSNSHLKNRLVINPYISEKLFLACLLKGSYL